MGPNLTEAALQRAVRSVSSLHAICQRFDAVSGVPCITTAHSTRSDMDDVKKTVAVVLQNKLLEQMKSRKHKSFASQPIAKVGYHKNKGLDRDKKERIHKVQRRDKK